MVEQMLSWHALNLQIQSCTCCNTALQSCPNAIRTFEIGQMHRRWQCKIQEVPLFCVGSTPTLVQALSIVL
mgnify:FL=1|jgi:hypothetical protein